MGSVALAQASEHLTAGVLAEHRHMGSMKVTVPPEAFGAHAEEWLCSELRYPDCLIMP